MTAEPSEPVAELSDSDFVTQGRNLVAEVAALLADPQSVITADVVATLATSSVALLTHEADPATAQVMIALRGRKELRQAVRDLEKWIARCSRRAHYNHLVPAGDDQKSLRNKIREDISRESINGSLHVITSLRTASVVLSRDPLWAGRIRLDELADAVVLGDKPLTDRDVLEIATRMEAEYGTEWPIGKVRDGIEHAASSNPFHPIREYLAGLPAWDGVPRVDRLLVDYFGADEALASRKLYAAYGRCLMIGMVARAIVPGSKLDNVVTLMGPKGFGKSSGLGELVSNPAWFADDRLPLEDLKRLGMALRGRWLIEFGDFATIRRADRDTVKTFLTQREDKYVPMHGRHVVAQPRTVVFVATCNDEQFLVEVDRRWWVVRITRRVDVAAIRADRDQLFAEAYALYQAGTPWWLDDELEQHQSSNVEQYAVSSPTADRIAEWWAAEVASSDRREHLSLDELWIAVMGSWNGQRRSVEPPKMTEAREFGQALRDAGWRKMANRRKYAGKRWYPPESR